MRPMTRVLLISPDSTDADVRAHAKAIASIPGIAVTPMEAAAGDRLVDAAWMAARLFRQRHAIDVIVTSGISALTAAYLAWRGPIVHLPVGRLTAPEARLVGRLARRGTFRIVTSSPSIARGATRRVINPLHVSVIRPTPDAISTRREEARERLGIAPDQPLVYLPGVARPGSDHRIALWASNILYFRDPAVRVLIVGGGPNEAFVRRFISSAEMWPAIVSDVTLDEADRAAAADVAICGASGAPDVFPLAVLARVGTPLAGMQMTWMREDLAEYPATLAEAPKARLLARAALEALEGDRAINRGASGSARMQSDWANVFAPLIARS
jgi:hypothetical protein